MGLYELARKYETQKALEGLMKKADSISDYSTVSGNMDFEPDEILNTINFLANIPGNKPRENLNGKLRSKFQKNWFNGVVSYSQMAGHAGYLSDKSKALLLALIDYTKHIEFQKDYAVEYVDVDVANFVLEKVQMDLHSASFQKLWNKML